MASFVAEALAAIGQGISDHTQPDIERLSTQSDDLKVEVMTFLKGRYVNFDAFLDKTITLHKRVEELTTLLTSTSTLLQCQMQSRSMPTSHTTGSSSEVEKVNTTLSILDVLLKIHRLHQKTTDQISSNDYTNATASLHQMKSLLTALDRWPELDITKSLRIEHTTLTESLRHSLTEEWNNIIKITKSDTSENQTIVIRICRSYPTSSLSQLANAVVTEGICRTRLKPLVDALKLACEWIINCPKTITQEKENDADLVIEVKRNSNLTTPVPPRKVFPQLKTLLQPLNQYLLGTRVTSGDTTTCLMRELGLLCSSDIIDLIVKQCLRPSVPASQSDLSSFKDSVNETIQFEKYLHSIEFIPGTCTSLSSYVGNLNMLYANKKCLDILSQARRIMKEELYNSVTLTPGDDATKWSSFIASGAPHSDGDSLSNSIQSQMAKLSENTLRFPVCSVSASTVKLLELAHSMLEEACTSSSEVCASHILYSVRSMFELYTSIVPEYHKETINSLPLVTALYYNNCLFLSHQLIMLANQYKARLSNVIKDSSTITFVDLVPMLRALGTEVYMDQISTQRQNLIDSLNQADGFTRLEVDDRFQTAQRSVDQCRIQLEHLKKLWANVLPSQNYCKTIGYLLNCVISHIITAATSIEDFTAQASSKLHQLITEVQEMSPSLFPGDKNTGLGHIQKNVKSWTRFKELGIILTASLQDIMDRWADGKGPLAVEFNANQVKTFIRALFKNTERRATCLKNIK